MKETIEKLISEGKIKVSDAISFRTKAECASLFGRNYSNILMGGIPHPVDKELGIVFWQQIDNERWENTYTENQKGEIVEFNEEKKIDYSEWIKEIKKDDRKIIFYKKEKEEYKFRGIFLIDFERSKVEGKKIYRRYSTEAKTYLPKNKKPLKDLKEIIERGLLKINEEIYLVYRGIEYSGRVTPEGKIRIPEGEFSVSKSAVILIKTHPEFEGKEEKANGYSWWKNWKGVPIGDLRKI